MADIKVKGILSFPHLITPRPGDKPTDEGSYATTVLIHETDPQLAAIKQQFENLKVAMGWKPHQKIALRDCRLPSFTQIPPDPKLAGYWQISCTAKASKKPHVVGLDGQPLMDHAMVYPGAEAWVVFNPFSYPNNGGGISAGLNGVMLTGEMGALGRLDNRPSAEQMFAGMGTVATAVATPPAAGGIQLPPAGKVMTVKANGQTYDALIAAGWTEAQLIENDMMEAPVAASPAATATPPPTAAATPPPPAATPPPPAATATPPPTAAATPPPPAAATATPPPPAAAPAGPVMTAKANGQTYEALIAGGWTHDLLVTHQMIEA